VQGTPFSKRCAAAFLRLGHRVSIREEVGEIPTTTGEGRRAKWCARATSWIVNTVAQALEETRTILRAPGFVPSAGEWFVEKKVKVVGTTRRP